jgi:pilus assembly protein Flp/PilA
VKGIFDMSLVVQFLRDDSGATAIEYALIAGGIAGVIVLVVQELGTKVTANYQAVSDNLK